MIHREKILFEQSGVDFIFSFYPNTIVSHVYKYNMLVITFATYHKIIYLLYYSKLKAYERLPIIFTQVILLSNAKNVYLTLGGLHHQIFFKLPNLLYELHAQIRHAFFSCFFLVKHYNSLINNSRLELQAFIFLNLNILDLLSVITKVYLHVCVSRNSRQ